MQKIYVHVPTFTSNQYLLETNMWAMKEKLFLDRIYRKERDQLARKKILIAVFFASQL